MNQTFPPNHNEHYPYGASDPPVKKSRKKLIVIAAAVVMVLIIIAAGVYSASSERSGSSSEVSGANSLTLYYRDGKTVLWESGQGTNWLHETKSGPAGFMVNELGNQFGDAALGRGEWKVTTTLDPSLQKAAEEDMKASEPQMKRQKANNAALIAEDVTNGQIVFMVGSMQGATEDIVTQKVEVGTLALPLTYAAVMDSNAAISANTTYDDTKGQLPGYACTKPVAFSAGGNCLYNFDQKYFGPVSVRQALGGLRLVPAVKASMQISLNDLYAFNKGLTTDGKFACYGDEHLSEEVQCYTSSVFGDGLFAKPKDMIQAYATLANGGKKLPQAAVLKAVQNSKTQYEWRQQSGQQAMKAETAKNITDILSDPGVSHFPLQYKDRFTVNGTKVSIVAGLEFDSTSGSIIQYSSKYAVGVWVTSTSEMPGFVETAVLPSTSVWMRSAH